MTAAGKTPAFADGQIAAIAATTRLTLVTINVTDFTGFGTIQVVNWQQPAVSM